MIEEYRAGRVTEAVVLVNDCTDTEMFQSLVRVAPVMFTRERLSYWYPGDDETKAAIRGSAIFYLGPKFGAFFQVFEEIAYAPNVGIKRQFCIGHA